MLTLGRPDDFRADPYGWLTNQMSHVLVGIAGAWIAGVLGAPAWAALSLVAGVAVALEALHLRRGGRFSDSVQDVTFVLLGALWQVGSGDPFVAVIIIVDLGLGVRARRRRRTAGEAG
jgi:hypothetical protein